MKKNKKWTKKKKLIMGLSGAGVLGAGAVAGATIGALQEVRLKPSASEIKRVSDLTVNYFQKWKDGTFDGDSLISRELSEEEQMIENVIVDGLSEDERFGELSRNDDGRGHPLREDKDDWLIIRNIKNISIYSNLEDWTVANKPDGYDVPGGWTYNRLQVTVPDNLNKMEITVNLYNNEELTFYIPVWSNVNTSKSVFFEWTSDGTTTFDDARFTFVNWGTEYQGHTGAIWNFVSGDAWWEDHTHEWYKENGYNRN